jgi:2-polyprenyl-3-methyl-5-hydroxy-6-metoxy-1,4-benzoquinol methylase
MDIGALFDEELEYMHTSVHGLSLKHMQQDAGQLAVGMPLTIWPGAYVLAEFLIESLPDHSGLTCSEQSVLPLSPSSAPSHRRPPFRLIELGAGTGLVGLSVSKQRPDISVTITDGELSSLELIRENAACNGCSADVMQLPWGSISADLEQQFDFVVGSDVVYAPDAVRPLLLSIRQLLKTEGEAYLANFKHRYNLHEALVKASAEEFGLDLAELESKSDIRLIQLTRSRRD